MDKLEIHVYAMCWNEGKILPYFLDHYSRFSQKIIIYDNYSTDRSTAIIRSCPIAEVRQYDTDDTYDESKMQIIRNNAYKESLGVADFVIIVDIDELLYHPTITEILTQYKKDGITIPLIEGFNMVSWRFPNRAAPITEIIRFGHESPSYAKRCIFHPDVDINFTPGCHECRPSGVIVENKNYDLKLLHYHYIGFLHIANKHRMRHKRQSDYNLAHNYGYQFSYGLFKLFLRFCLYHMRARTII